MPKRPTRKPAPKRPAAKKKASTKKAPAQKTPAKKAPAKAAPAKKKGSKAGAPTVTGQQRAFLRGLGHHLNPVVQIGHKGLSAEVLKELDHALVSHELLKVKLLRSAPLSVSEAAAQMSAAAGAVVAQTIGKVVLLYRPSPDPDRRKIALPRAKTEALLDEEGPTEDLEVYRDEE